MVDRVSGPGRAYQPMRVQLLKDRLHPNVRVEFRYRGSRRTGRVVELHPRTVTIEFHDGDAGRTGTVKYSSVLRVLGP